MSSEIGAPAAGGAPHKTVIPTCRSTARNIARIRQLYFGETAQRRYVVLLVSHLAVLPLAVNVKARRTPTITPPR
jgi:hypothetical protein